MSTRLRGRRWTPSAPLNDSLDSSGLDPTRQHATRLRRCSPVSRVSRVSCVELVCFRPDLPISWAIGWAISTIGTGHARAHGRSICLHLTGAEWILQDGGIRSSNYAKSSASLGRHCQKFCTAGLDQRTIQCIFQQVVLWTCHKLATGLKRSKIAVLEALASFEKGFGARRRFVGGLRIPSHSAAWVQIITARTAESG